MTLTASMADQAKGAVLRADGHPVDVEEKPRIRHVDQWPNPLGESAYVGVFGDAVRTIAPHTEADSVAILLQLMAMFGSVIGRAAYWEVERDRHYLNLFLLLVGISAKGRKGVSHGHSAALIEPVDAEWVAQCQLSGLSSGEGLIWAVRDKIEKQHPIKERGHVTDYETVIEDHGVEDKRLFVVETEFAGTLRVMNREGNTLSALIRQAWDGKQLRSATKNSPARATGAHITINGHITRDELRRYLDATERANGFANRFLFVCVKRSRCLPDGGQLPPLDAVIAHLLEAVTYARTVGLMRRSQEARQRWHEVYPSLSAERPGLVGTLTGRAEAQVMRLACLYALGDLSSTVERVHLEAALELWRYCFDSTRYVFSGRLGHPMADEILIALRQAADGLTRTEIRDLFGRNKDREQINTALEVIAANGLAQMTKDQNTGGKPAERWTACAAYDINDQDDQSPSSTPSVVNVVNVAAAPPSEEDTTDRLEVRHDA